MLVVAILPEQKRPTLLPFGLAHAYEVLTGSKQNWNMFGTIPSLRDYHVRLVITDADGKERGLGPLLPGFQDYPLPERARLYNLFERMLDGTMGEDVRDAYLRRVDKELVDEHRIVPGESWCLEVTEDYTRLLVSVRRDGRLFERRVRRISLAAQEPPSNP